jgi:xylulokinase
MPKKYLLGVDIGTNSCKGVIVEASSGNVLGSHVVEHSISMPKPGWAEHDANKIWWGEFIEICHNLFSKTKVNPSEIYAVGTSGLGACVLPINSSGEPLRPAILYGIDTRALSEMDELEEKFGKKRIYQISLMDLSTQSTGPKILWIKNNEPEVFRETSFFLTSESFLVYKLTGKATLDYFIAGDYAPMFDVRKNCWDKEMTTYITPLEKLPNLFWSCDLAGKVTASAAKETGLLEGTPVIVGTADGGSEALSAGVSNIGDMMMMFGSSFYFILKTERIIPTELIWSSAWLEEGSYTLQGGTSTSGSLTRWFRDNLAPIEMAIQNSGGENAYASLAKLLDQSSLGANGLIALPYFEGERTPVHDPQARGVLFGMTLKNSRADIYRALLEGVGFGIRHILDEMQREKVYPKRMVGVGGGTHNLGWMQIISDIANIEMVIPEQQIGACYGDAFMAGVGIGLFKNLNEIDQWVRIKCKIKPDPNAHKQYDIFYKIFRDLYKKTAPLMHNLTHLYRGG